MTKPHYEHLFIYSYTTKKKNWEFKLETNSARQYVDSLFSTWKLETYIWTPENFRKFLRTRDIKARVAEASYINLV